MGDGFQYIFQQVRRPDKAMSNITEMDVMVNSQWSTSPHVHETAHFFAEPQ
jgi:hypothetical protein